MTALADIYDYQHRYEPAEKFYKESLEIREETLEPNHPEIVISLNNLAHFYKSRSKYDDALTAAMRSALDKGTAPIAPETEGGSHTAGQGKNNG